MIGSYKNRAEMARLCIPANSVGAEIGVHRGGFAHELLSLPIAKLYLVDAWATYPAYSSEPQFNNSNHELNLNVTIAVLEDSIVAGRAKIVRGFSNTIALGDHVPSLDWFYLDANHRYEFVFTDLVAWSLKLKPGGIIMGHDYVSRPGENCGVIRAVDEFCARFGWRIEGLTIDDTPSYMLRREPKP